VQMSMPQSEGVSLIIREAARSPLGAVVLLALLLWGLAYSYFGKERVQKDGRLLLYRFAVLPLCFAGAAGGAWFVHSLSVGAVQASVATPMQPPRSKNPRSVPGRGRQGSEMQCAPAVPDAFASQIERANRFARLSDYAHACEIYSAALISLPENVVTGSESKTVFQEASKCGKGSSQEVVEHLAVIVSRVTKEQGE
jgi:hypothetical protein